jgi:hypothetical protein
MRSMVTGPETCDGAAHRAIAAEAQAEQEPSRSAAASTPQPAVTSSSSATVTFTPAELHANAVKGSAGRLIDVLVGSRSDVRASPEIRAKAVELVLGERKADREAFTQAVRELAALLEQASKARRRSSLRLVKDEHPGESP